MELATVRAVSHQDLPNQVDVAIGIVLQDDKVLICQRKQNQADAFAGYWEFPGGKCRTGEAPQECVRRELKEELAIQVTPLRALPVIEHSYPSVFVRLHPFLCRLDSGEPRALSAQRWRWVRCEELAAYRFPEANQRLLRELSQGKWGIDSGQVGA